MFSGAEMRRRRAAFGAEMERNGVRYALVYGANRSGSAVSWLTGWPVTREALLVAGPAVEEDVLLVAFRNHVPQARRLSTARVEWAGPQAVATALVKSAEEMAALRRGAALTDAAIAALAEALRPGVTDHEVVARAEQAYVAQGGLHYIHYLGITAMDEPALGVPAQWPTGHVIRHRDVVTCEISAAAAPEYAGQVLRTFTVGASPTALYAELHAVAVAAFDAVARNLVPGASARDLAAAGSVIEEAGFTGIDDLVHGFGGGYLPPVVPPPGRGTAVPEFSLAAGMTLVVQPNVVTRDGRAGVQTGELLLVTEEGPQRLHAFPPGLHQRA